jgi:hypothetical protein
MKKQKQKELSVKEITSLVGQQHKMKEVAPPEGAGRANMLDGKPAMTVKEATANWFKAAKEQNPSSAFLDVPSEGLKPAAGLDREMLYKGKKK